MWVNIMIFILTVFLMGLFCAAYGYQGRGRTKSSPLPSLKYVTNILQMKLDTVIPYLKKIQNVYESRDILLEFY